MIPDGSKYRIVQYGVNHFEIQQRVLGLFWMNCTEYGSHSLADAMETIRVWEADEAVRGIVHPVIDNNQTGD